MGRLSHDVIAQIIETTERAGLQDQRKALFSGRLKELESHLRVDPTLPPIAQLVLDVNTLNDWPDPVAGKPALAIWLEDAMLLRRADLAVQTVFGRALALVLGKRAPKARAGDDLSWLHLGGLQISGPWEDRADLCSVVCALPVLAGELGLDFVFVTGDLTRGGLADELDHAWRFLERVVAGLGLSLEEGLFLSPGERDMEPTRTGALVRRALLDGLLAPGIDRVAQSREFIKQPALVDPLEPYLARIPRRLPAPAAGGAELGAWRATSVGRAGVGELCGVWSALPGSSRRLLGSFQIDEVWRPLRAAEVRFLLNDRPFDEYADADVVRTALGRLPSGWGATFVLTAGERRCQQGHGSILVCTPGLTPEGLLEASVGRYSSRTGVLDVSWHGFAAAPDAKPVALERLRVTTERAAPAPFQTIADVIRDGTRANLPRTLWAAMGAFSLSGENEILPQASLENLFVPPTFEDYPLDRGGARGDTHQIADLLGWLRGPGGAMVVVFGEPGSGKSTLALEIARRLSSEASGNADVVPLFVQLRFVGRALQGKDEILRTVQAELSRVVGVSLDVELIESLLRRERCVLIVDGLDYLSPVPDEPLGAPAPPHAIFVDFLQEFPGVSCLLTSRIRAGAFQPPERAHFVHMRPFSGEQLERLVSRWCEIVDPTLASARRRAEHFRAELLERRRSRPSLAMTPLLVLLSLAVYSAAGSVPARRATLYAAFVGTLLERRRAEGRLAGVEAARLRRYLEQLAYWMFEHDCVSVPVADAQRELQRMIDDDLEPEADGALAAAMLSYFTNEVDLLAVDGDLVRFAHHTLFEYLAGQGFLRRELANGYRACAEAICQKAPYDRWREALLLMLGSETAKVDLASRVVLRLVGTAKDPGVLLFVLLMLRDGVDVDGQVLRRLPDILRSVRRRTTLAYQGYFLNEHMEAGKGVVSSTHLKASIAPLVVEARAALEEIASSEGRYGQAVRAWTNAQLRSDSLRTANERTEEELLTLALTVPPALLGQVRLAELRESVGAHVIPLFLQLWPYEQVGRRAREIARRSEIAAWAHAARNIELIAPWSLVFLRERWADGAAAFTVALLQRSAWLERWTAAAGPSGGTVRDLELRIGCLQSGRVRVSNAFRFVSRSLAVPTRRDGHASIARAVASRVLTDLTGTLDARLGSSAGVSELSAVIQRSYKVNLPRELYERFRKAQCHRLEDIGDVLQQNVKLLQQVYPAHICQAAAQHLSYEVVEVTAKPSPADSASTDLLCLSSPESASDRQAWDHALLRHLMHLAMGALQASLAGEAPGEELWQIAAIRAQNWWLHTFWGTMCEQVAVLDPDQQWGHEALLLAIGLAQYQTTWQWPAGSAWSRRLGGEPPRHWMPRCVWHLCWAVSTSGEARREHDAAFRSAVEEGRKEWPELVAELGHYCVVGPAKGEPSALAARRAQGSGSEGSARLADGEGSATLP